MCFLLWILTVALLPQDDIGCLANIVRNYELKNLCHAERSVSIHLLSLVLSLWILTVALLPQDDIECFMGLGAWNAYALEQKKETWGRFFF